MRFNESGSGEQVVLGGARFLGAGDFGVFLNIGGTLYTTLDGSANSSAVSSQPHFDTIDIDNMTGTADFGCTGEGRGSADVTYGETIGGKLYQLIRHIS